MANDNTIAIFVSELILLLFFGRLFGEILNRLGQPSIFGQLLAGVLLGPSVFGAALPELRQMLFPNTPALKSMIDAISQIGILLLLLLTGMETNLALVDRKRGAIISTSLLGILVPFVSGVALVYAMPDSMLPNKAARLVTALFLGTALSISSVKIVAMVLIEVGAIRRDIGQLILTTAVLDDTIAWVVIAVIAGIAAQGSVSVSSIAASIVSIGIFLVFSLSVGRRIVSRIIRWTNDSMTIEVPVITAILVVMFTMALSTELIGVHTALGAFVAGLLIGQSPILTEHIEGELRGLIIAFFSPIFFAVAGLGMDLRTLLDPTSLGFTLVVVGVASFGKFLGAYLGGILGGLSNHEALALGAGLNARGSTEVIIASIGLTLGALTPPLYTMIVAMAIVTTMAMPPTLRWMLARVPLQEEESKRLDKEDAEEQDTLPKLERALVFVDGSQNGLRTAAIAGMFAANQQILVTVLTKAGTERDAGAHALSSLREIVEGSVKAAAGQHAHNADAAVARPAALPLVDMIQVRALTSDDALLSEIAKGYGIIFIGTDHPILETGQRFDPLVQRLVEEFNGPVAIMLNAQQFAIEATAPIEILVPTGGTSMARLATEIALSLARASNSELTALHVFEPREDAEFLRGRLRRQGMTILADARRRGRRIGVPVKALSMINSNPELAIRRAARSSKNGLIVIGSSLRRGSAKFIGRRTAALVRTLRTPMLLIVR